MTVKELVDFLHEVAPNHLQESYDNSGLLVGNYESEIKGVLISLDVTEEVIEEAQALGCNMIISHHPIIFSGLKRIVGANFIQRIVAQAIKNDLNLFAIHTNLDNTFEQGVNQNIANRLALTNQSILLPKDPEVPEIGAGIIGFIEPTSELKFLELLKDKMEASSIRYTTLRDRPIQKVAICGGSGRFLLEAAKAQNADIFISSDFKYHEFFEADGQIVIADIGHFESEQFTSQLIQGIINDKFSTFAAHLTKVNTNPVSYL